MDFCSPGDEGKMPCIFEASKIQKTLPCPTAGGAARAPAPGMQDALTLLCPTLL